MDGREVKEIVKKSYSNMSKTGCCGSKCGCDNKKTNIDISKRIGYNEKEINNVKEANLGLGCGNPVALAHIKEGDCVLDLGSGAGFDSFLAAKKVGEKGKVIGVDITPKMIEKATSLAKKYGYKNTEFKLGDIENLPLQDNSIDVIISNCVINLAPNKKKVFSEAKRVLKENGKMFVSDIVLLEEISKEKRNDEKMICGCVGGALIKQDYLDIIESVGLYYEILGEDKEISKDQYKGVCLESLKLKITKRQDQSCGCK